MSYKNQFIIHSFPRIELELIDGKWKKKPLGLRTGWAELTESSIDKKHSCFGLLTGEKSGVLVLDFDNIDLMDEYAMKYPSIADAPRVQTRKGFHLYFKWNKKFTQLPSKIGKLDIQGNGKQVFYPDTQYLTETGYIFIYKWVNEPEDVMELPNELFNELKSYKKEKTTVVTPDTGFHIDCNDKLWKDIIENIKIKYIDEYHSWFQIVCGCYKLGKEAGALDEYKEVARALSMKSKKYDKSHKEFEQLWETCYKYNYSPATIRHYSRESDEKKYLEICKRHAGKESQYYVFDEKLLCNYFIEAFADNMVCNYNKIYIYHKNNWILDNNGMIVKKFLIDEVKKLYQNIINSLNQKLKEAEEDDEKEAITKKIGVCCKILTTYGNQKNQNVWALIKSELVARNTDVEIFDTHPYYFVFTNKAYNLETNTWFHIKKFDYILTTCGKDYITPTQEQYNKVVNTIEDIFPNKEYRKSYLSFLKNAMTGIRTEKFITATGEGRNGKGVINDFMKYLLGDYYGTLHLQLLTKEIKSGANAELRNCHKKRFLKATEPDSGSTEKLRMSNIKAMTGESNLSARGLYESGFDITIDATIILECNKLPFITMDGNEAEKQRMVLIPFESVFTDNQFDIETEPETYKQADPSLKSDDFYSNHYSALFKYIIDSCHTNDLYIPDECKNLALKWMLDKDDIVGWFCDNYYEQENNIISIKDIYKEFKYSTFFDKMSKAEQRKYNEKCFKEMIKGKLKHLFVYNNSMVNGVRITKDSIKNWAKKAPDYSSDEVA